MEQREDRKSSTPDKHARNPSVQVVVGLNQEKTENDEKTNRKREVNAQK